MQNYDDWKDRQEDYFCKCLTEQLNNALCCNCGTVNLIEDQYCKTCGIDIKQMFELKSPSEAVPEIPSDMLKASRDLEPIKYDKDLF